MKVLLVCNNAYNPGNGLSVAVLSNLENLRKHGVDARLMAVRNPDPDGPQPDFPLEHFIIPLFEPIIKANGFMFAKNSKKAFQEAVEWADVIHLEEALPLEVAILKYIRKAGKPCVATFHLFPHNITANLGMPKRNLLNPIILYFWRELVFNFCSDIHCPTNEVRNYLLANKFKARMHTISNGMEFPEIMDGSKLGAELPETINILCIGRLAKEKSQNTLMEAMRYSKYADRIQLQFAGDGPKNRKYRKLAARLVRQGVIAKEPNFGFYDHDQLKDLARNAYLYVHCAWVEVEGLSCLEAFAEGAVPIIGEGPLIGTSQFAITPSSLYPVCDSKALAERIDWWIEHPEERERMSREYVKSASRYNLEDSIQELIRMYQGAIDNNPTR